MTPMSFAASSAIVDGQMTAPNQTAQEHGGTGLFDRVVCGVDHSEAGVAAARVAATVTAAEGTLTLLAVEDPSIAVHAGWNMPHVLEELAADAATALEQGRAAAEPVHPVEIRLTDGDPVQRLLAEIATKRASAVVVGSHGRSRATGIALGSVSTTLLHEAPCAVLVVRGEIDAGWPRRIVVGVDGSDGSARAYEAAAELAARLGAVLRAIVATEGQVDLAAARRIAPGARGARGRSPRRARRRVRDRRPRRRRQPRAARPPGARQRQRASCARGPLLRPRRARQRLVRSELRPTVET